MGISGTYVLELICDNVDCEHKTSTTLKADDSHHAVRSARTKGWRIASANAWCPECTGGRPKGTR